MKGCKNKLLLSLVFGVFLFLMFTVSVQGAVEKLTDENITICIRDPGCDSILKGVTKVNLTFNPVYGFDNWNSSDVYIYSAGNTANTTIYLINDSGVKKFTLNDSDNMTITIDSRKFNDGNDYVLIFSVFNGTDHVNKTVSGLTIDNGIPVVSAPLPTSDTDGHVNFSATSSQNSTRCYLNFTSKNPGLPSYTMSKMLGRESASYNVTASEETYTWFVTCTDYSNNSRSATQTTLVKIDTGATAGGTILLTAEKTDVTGLRTLSLAEGTNGGVNTGAIVVIVIFILVVVGVVIFIVKKK